MVAILKILCLNFYITLLSTILYILILNLISFSEVIDEKRKIDLYPSEYRYMIAKAQEDTHFKELFTSDAIISYPDYIFLRSVLIRPDDLCMKSFQMLDLNNDGTISHDEYKELYKMFSKNRESDPKRSLTTTLQIKLFGIDEKSKVTVSDFEQLIQEVQHHCLRAEFNQFTHGTDHIPKAAFMKSILRRTKVTDIQYSRFVDKVEGYRPEQQVSFTQFVSVINLLNNFSDFEVAVRMYQIAKKPISRSIFQRAALVCSGQKLDDDIVDLIYYVFDEAGDGKLSHSEFVNIMREKRTQSIHSTKNEGPLTTGQYYKKCIRTQMWRAYA